MHKVLLKLLLRPDLISVHVQAYAELLSEESGLLVRQLRNRLLLMALGMVSLVLAVLWGGMALLLWSALPALDPRSAWVLWAFPLAWAALAAACGGIYRMCSAAVFFPRVREQIELDVLTLKQAGKT